VFKERPPGSGKHPGKLGPGIGRAHIDVANGLNARPQWLDKMIDGTLKPNLSKIEI